MRKLRRYILFTFLMACICPLYATPSITNVKAEQTSWGTWITYTLRETVSENDYSLAVCASNRQTKVIVFGKTITGDVSLKKGTHVIQWYTVKDDILWNNAQIDFKVSIENAVQLWKDGPYWAKCNVGTTKPEGYGHYFAWGATAIGYYNYTVGAVTGTKSLTSAQDAATQDVGLMWRMPTANEGYNLMVNTTMTWTNRNHVAGYLVKGKGAFSDRSIFLPAAGCYQYSSTKYSDGTVSETYTLTGKGTECRYWTSDPYAFLGKSYASAIRPGSSSDYQFSSRKNCLPIRPVLQISK